MLRTKSVSLFSPQMIAHQHHRHLLLQFLLSDLFRAHEAFCMDQNSEEILKEDPYFFPYDWGSKMGHLNKVKEHVLLLRASFPNHFEVVENIEQSLFLWIEEGVSPDSFDSHCHKVYSLLECLIELCKEEENLIFFLLKNRITIDKVMGENHLYQFFSRLYQNQLETLQEVLCDRYHRRGFFSLIPECKSLFGLLFPRTH